MTDLLSRSFDGTLEGWLRAASAALREGIPPGALQWAVDGQDGFFGDRPPLDRDDAVEIPRLFVRLARSVSCHRDPGRWSALYLVAWRLTHGEPALLSVVTDPAVHRLIMMHRGVRRAAHKMKAFVRFRRIEDAGGEAYVAWFEPVHHVVERTAPFFATRFRSMRWSILTPDRCAHWDRHALSFSPGVTRSAAPTDDGLEELWRTYYANIFNPARLNSASMLGEMPRQYWRNLPEARIIADLRRDAPGRVRTMIAQAATTPELMPEEFAAVVPQTRAVTSSFDIPGAWDPEHDPGVSVAQERERAVTSTAARELSIGTTPVAIGVAGWTDPSLLIPGLFYPPECTTPETRLRYYASRYSMVEVDSTYYSMPSRAVATLWASRTPDPFTFNVKAHAIMTGHPTDVRRLPDWIRRALPRGEQSSLRVVTDSLPNEIITEAWSRFRSALEPIRSCGKLGAIMIQFPRWFAPSRKNANRLRQIREMLGDDIGTIEFRNRQWMEGRIADRTIALLRDLGLSYVVVDAPPGMESSMPPTVAVTDPRLVVFRLHGRRTATWEAKNDPVTERYRYLYDAAQLEAWAPPMIEASFGAARMHVTFNNNHANYATTNAAEMAAQLEIEYWRRATRRAQLTG